MADQGRSRKQKRAIKSKPGPENNQTEQEQLISPDRQAGKVRDQTKEKFDQLMRQALEQNGGKKKKKKQRSQTADSVLESLHDDLAKDDSHDTSRLANTFDPDDFPKSMKSNKRRQRLREAGLENPSYESDIVSEKRKSLTKNNKKSPKKERNSDKTMTLEELASPPPSTAKRKRKKKILTEPAGEEMEDQDTNQPEKSGSVKDKVMEGVRTDKKKMKKKAPSEETVGEDDYVPPDIEDDGRILGVSVHQSDKLKTDFYISHPLVRVHVVNANTGGYLKKQHRNRPVTSYYEEVIESRTVNFILPIMTQPFDFKKEKSTLPVWEEMLVFNENFNYFLQEKPRVILFFEVLDFVSMKTASQRYNTARHEGGWHRIAWAFLKVFQWWMDFPRVNYPSTLYVTIKGITPPNEVEPATRSMFATQRETGLRSYTDLEKTLELGEKLESREDAKKGPSSWTRLTGQVCKVPNRLSLSLPTGRQGCFVIKFSHDGRRIACACHDKGVYPILIYQIPSGRLKGRLLGHYSIIYDLVWSKNDKHILTASADGTARIWNSHKFNTSEDKMLPHPSFVYTAQYHPRVNTVISTGGYDRTIRVWSSDVDGNHAQLLQELDGHEGFVNSLCFDEDGQKMYSGGSLGVIHVWNVYVTEKPGRKGVLREWSSHKEIRDEEFKNVPINMVRMHPGGRRLLVHFRDNTIRLVDLRLFTVMQRYIGALNFREQIRSAISPCGSFIIAGSEDSIAYVWNTETGDQVAMYTELNYKNPISDVDFHPYDHMVAFCTFRDNQPILIYTYDHQVAQVDAGFTLPAGSSTGIKTLKPAASSTSAKGPADSSKATPSSTLLRTATMTPTEFNLQKTNRLDKVMSKLNAVSLFSESTRMRTPSLESTMSPQFTSTPGGMTSVMNSTGGWGTSTFNQTTLGRTKSPVHTAFSPHAVTNMNTTMQQQQLASQTKYYRDSPNAWRPSFGSIGRQGSYRGGISNYSRPPQIALNMTQGKAQFTFQGSTKKQKQVVSLYDYAAQRSDELSLARGDVISVLYKDSENWWMGQLTSGQQGFFPANYVATKDTIDAESESDLQVHTDEELIKQKKTVAVTSQSGELKFISETEDSEQDTPKKRGRRRRQGSQEDLDATERHQLPGKHSTLSKTTNQTSGIA